MFIISITRSFFILETFVAVALGCACIRQHPVNYFCKSELALKVHIHEHFKKRGEVYMVEILRVFKGNIQNLKFKKNKSVILRMPELCADILKTGKTYVIFGKHKNGRLHTNLCSGNRLWIRTRPFVREGLGRKYKDKCNSLMNAVA